MLHFDKVGICLSKRTVEANSFEYTLLLKFYLFHFIVLSDNVKRLNLNCFFFLYECCDLRKYFPPPCVTILNQPPYALNITITYVCPHKAKFINELQFYWSCKGRNFAKEWTVSRLPCTYLINGVKPLLLFLIFFAPSELYFFTNLQFYSDFSFNWIDSLKILPLHPLLWSQYLWMMIFFFIVCAGWCNAMWSFEIITCNILCYTLQNFNLFHLINFIRVQSVLFILCLLIC